MGVNGGGKRVNCPGAPGERLQGPGAFRFVTPEPGVLFLGLNHHTGPKEASTVRGKCVREALFPPFFFIFLNE